MKAFNIIISILLLGSVYFNYVNYQKNKDTQEQIVEINARMKRNNIPDNLLRNAYNFLHKVVAKEPLRKYTYVLNRPEYRGNTANPYPNKIWFYWSDGLEKAPSIVRTCLKNIKKYVPDMEVVLIDKHNIEKYIKLPNYIWKKYRSGIIREAHFSDIIRVFLLREYGGLWLDCTVFLTGKIPEDMFNTDFFAPSLCDINPKKDPQFKFRNFVIPGAICNHFMYASKPHNYIFECLVAFLREYWKEKDWADYFVFYEFTAVAMEEDKKFFDIILNMLRHHYYPETPFLELNSALDEKFDPVRWKEIKKFPIHKICGAVVWDKKEIVEGTFADKLVKNELD